ncbi:MAG: ABC transporter permease [Verrucomicrobiota bacterium]
MAGIVPPAVAADASSFQRKPGLMAWLVLLPLLAWLVIFVVVPTVMLVLLSFGEQKGLGTIHFTFTLDNYVRAFDWTWVKVLLVSVWYAFLATIICMVVGYPVAYFIGRSPEKVRTILLTLVMIPFWTSFLIRTYAWITILSKEGLVNSLLVAAQIIPEPITILYTPFASVLGLVYNYLPFMILPIYTSVERLDNAMVEAAYDLGAGPLRAFSQVIIPLTRPGIVAGTLLVFVPAIAMFAITNLMGGGSPPTIGEVIYKQFTSGRNQPFGAALGTLLLLIFIISLCLTRKQREE